MEKIDLTDNAIRMLEKRYLEKDGSGKVKETVEEIFLRLAKNVASAERLYGAAKEEIKAKEEEFYEIMASLEFLPDSSILMGTGERPLSACFVLPLEDSIESVFEAAKDAAIIHGLGGGTGFSFSKLRPGREGVLSNSASFMKLFEAATGAVKQEGGQRGANIGLLRIDHPDILEFISLRGGNLSFGLTDKFMEAVSEDKEYSLIDPVSKKSLRRLKARVVFSKLLQLACKRGKLSIIFLDRINKDNPTPKIGRIEAVSPYGEQPLLPYEFCSFGAINLSKMTTKVSGKIKIDYQKLAKVAETAVGF
ncbi:ribonucleotide-diphosphate reductase subunit alpha, partial [bacterium]|nr:ribonucleotide-diphosphate reductase subunit alpha [bacterium]